MIKKIVYTLVVSIISLFSNFLVAETRNYQIELIVFSQSWPNTEVFAQTSRRIEWPNNLTELSTFPQLSQMMLDKSVTELSKNSAYQTLLHIGWVQGIDENSQANPVHIQSVDGKINGYLQIQRGPIMQFTVDLEYTPGQTDSNGEPFIYRLNEKRIFQPNDLHYLDHPMFGAITKITF